MLAGIVVSGLVALPLVWAAGIEPRLLAKTHVDVCIPGLPEKWHGKRIAALGDFQIGVRWANTGTSRRAVKSAVEARPSAILLLGDYLYHPSSDAHNAISKVKDLLDPLRSAGIPAYAVLGNHDYGLDDSGTRPPGEIAGAIREALTGIGIVVLENAAVELPTPSADPGREERSLWLVAIGSRDAKKQDVTAALAAVPDDSPRIVMMHNPHSYADLPARAAPFAVAGHTHGAQVRIPFLPGRSWLARHEGAAAHASGWAASGFGEPGNSLYVNRGIGFSGLPLRFGARPELTIFRLFKR